jgi:hypothetical protein
LFLISGFEKFLNFKIGKITKKNFLNFFYTGQNMLMKNRGRFINRKSTSGDATHFFLVRLINYWALINYKIVIFVWGIKNGCVHRIKEKSLDLTIKVKDKFVCFFLLVIQIWGKLRKSWENITKFMRDSWWEHTSFCEGQRWYMLHTLNLFKLKYTKILLNLWCTLLFFRIRISVKNINFLLIELESW